MPLIGFRTEDLYGEKYRNLKEVADHEINELENTDIVDTLSKHLDRTLSNKESLKYIADLYKQGFKECVWICDSVQDFLDEYDDPEGDEEGKEIVYGMDRYEFWDGEYEIISDMGTAGKLVAYRRRPIVIPIGAISRSDPRGTLYYGWASPAWARKLHYFVNGISLCMKFQHFGRSQPQSPKPFSIEHFCQTCMRLLCDKIIITGLPVNTGLLRNYINEKRRADTLELRGNPNRGVAEYEMNQIKEKIYKSAGFNEETNQQIVIYDREKFDNELTQILNAAMSCQKCHVLPDLSHNCPQCGKFISQVDNYKSLERIADTTRRS